MAKKQIWMCKKCKSFFPTVGLDRCPRCGGSVELTDIDAEIFTVADEGEQEKMKSRYITRRKASNVSEKIVVYSDKNTSAVGFLVFCGFILFVCFLFYGIMQIGTMTNFENGLKSIVIGCMILAATLVIKQVVNDIRDIRNNSIHK